MLAKHKKYQKDNGRLATKTTRMDKTYIFAIHNTQALSQLSLPILPES